jgi:hypothetical protein
MAAVMMSHALYRLMAAPRVDCRLGAELSCLCDEAGIALSCGIFRLWLILVRVDRLVPRLKAELQDLERLGVRLA